MAEVQFHGGMGRAEVSMSVLMEVKCDEGTNKDESGGGLCDEPGGSGRLLPSAV